MTTTQVMYGLPAENPDLYYALGVIVTDPLIYIASGRSDYVIVHDTEIDVMKRTAKPGHILSYTDYFRKAKSRTKHPDDADLCLAFLKEKKIRKVTIHPLTPAFFVEKLRKNAIKVAIGPYPFIPARIVKTASEVRTITQAQTATFKATKLVETILRQSRIKGNKLYYKGKVLTAEFLQTEAKMQLMRAGYNCPNGMIIACGNDSTEPHNRGQGPIRPYESIIVDIFPQDAETQFFGDATRSFCKGKPSPKLMHMYLAVKEAQEMAIRMIRPGIDGTTIHTAIHKLFKELGYTTEKKKGRMVGFTHGTGHGLGVTIHEDPVRISWKSFTLKTGHVVTVEPGLYYPGIGGVRIEDIVVVTKTGCKVLGHYPKKLTV